MQTIDDFLQELEQESRTTRRVLERVPDDRLNWQPHAKSLTLGQLSLHVANVPGGVAAVAAEPQSQVRQFVFPSPNSAGELIPALDASIAKARSVLSAMDEATLAGNWRLMQGDRELFSIPRSAFLRSIMLNHWYHHRGQLTVYLRSLDIPVPSIYGPSADENPLL